MEAGVIEERMHIASQHSRKSVRSAPVKMGGGGMEGGVGRGLG